MPTYRDHLMKILDLIETDAEGNYYLPESKQTNLAIGQATLFLESESEPWHPTPQPKLQGHP